MAKRKRILSEHAERLRELLKEGVFLVAGDSSGAVNIGWDGSKVSVGLVFEVTGYGPHPAAIYIDQGGREQRALEAAHEILEDWVRERHEKDLEARAKEREQLEMFDGEYENEDETTENFSGETFTIDAEDFAQAIRGTDVEKYVDLYQEDKEVDEKKARELGEVLADVFQEQGFITKGGHATGYRGYLLDVKEKGLTHDWFVAKIRFLDDKRLVIEEEREPNIVRNALASAGLQKHVEVLEDWEG